MLITMKEAIERAILWEDKKPQPTLLTSSKAEWNGISVKEAITRPEIQQLLIRSMRDRNLFFQNSLTKAQLAQEIDEFVTMELKVLIDRDFFIPDPAPAPAPEPEPTPVLHERLSTALFSDNEILELITDKPDLLFNLKATLKEIEGNEYKYMNVKDYTGALVALENKKKPDLGLQFAINDGICPIIYEWVRSGQEHGRLVHVTETTFSSHSKYVDYKLVDGKPSVLWIDSWCVNDKMGLFFDLQESIAVLSKDMGKEIRLRGVELKTQTDGYNCHIFALNTAKQAYKDKEGLDALHQRNVDVPLSEGTLLFADDCVPAHFFKHSQSSWRVEDYLEDNPKEANEAVNQKGETIKQYQANHRIYSEHDKEKWMRSISQKRLAYLTELSDALGLTFHNSI